MPGDRQRADTIGSGIGGIETLETQKQVLIGWQFPDELVEYEGESKPMMMSKTYTASLGEKASLPKDLEAWRGRAFTKEELAAFDLRSILGKCCQLQVAHITKDVRTYANINSIMKLAKGMPEFQPVGPLVYFDLAEGKPLPEGTPEWIATRIADAPEFKNGTAATAPADEEVPF